MKILPELLLLVGAGTLCYGIWLIHEPSAFITGGLICIAAGLRLATSS